MAEPKHRPGAPLWGVAAEFDTPDAMLAALHGLRDHDLGRLDAFSPAPVAGVPEALRLDQRPLYPLGMASAVVGGAAMFGMCTYATIVSYRFDIGGRPLFSWPSFIVPSVSFGALTGSLVVVLVMLALNRLPRLNHPAFNIPGFTRATEHGFFVAVEARDDSFDAGRVETALAALAIPPRQISRVPR